MTAPAINRVLAHTGARYPIIQAPMGLDCAHAAGLGGVARGWAGHHGDLVRRNRQLPGRDHQDERAGPAVYEPAHPLLKDDAMLRFMRHVRREVCDHLGGQPGQFIAPLKDAGIIVYHAVPTVDAALKCVDAGIDGLVVEGEGGGFKNPEEVSTLVLLQAIRAQVDVPLVAAGGIRDGRGMAAAFALGAEAVQMGTRFVSCAEAPRTPTTKRHRRCRRDRHLDAQHQGQPLHPRSSRSARRPSTRRA